MPKDEPVSFTDTGDLDKGGGMDDLIRHKGGATTTGDGTSGTGTGTTGGGTTGTGTGTETGTSTSTSTGTGKKKKKKGKKTVVKRKRRKDRYESQNYLLRIEGTLCCASIIIGVIWLISVFVALLGFLIYANFELDATTDSVKNK